MKRKSFLLTSIMMLSALACLASCRDTSKVNPDPVVDSGDGEGEGQGGQGQGEQGGENQGGQGQGEGQGEQGGENQGGQGQGEGQGEQGGENQGGEGQGEGQGEQGGENQGGEVDEKVTISLSCFDVVIGTQIGEASSIEVSKGVKVSELASLQIEGYSLIQVVSGVDGEVLDSATEINADVTCRAYYLKDTYTLADNPTLFAFTGYELASDGTITLDKGLNKETYNVKFTTEIPGKVTFTITYKAKNKKIDHGKTAAARIQYGNEEIEGIDLDSDNLGPVTSQYEFFATEKKNEFYIGRVGGTGAIITAISVSIELAETSKVTLHIGDTTSEVEVVVGAKVSVYEKALEEKGYTLKLYTDSALTQEVASDTVIAGGEEIWVVYTPIDYTVKFMDGETELSKVENAHYDDAIVAPADPSKDNHRFAGWKNEKGEVVDFTTYKVSGNEIFTAYYVETVNVSFVVDGETLSTVTVDKGTAVTLPSEPEKTGYTFDGWFVGENELDATIVNETVTAEAKFTIISYSVSLDLAGGELPEGVTVPTTIDYGMELTLPAATKSGFDFVNWVDAEGNTYNAGDKLQNKDIALTAVFAEQAGVTYFDVKFNTNGGSDVVPLRVAEGETFTLPTVTKDGYEFEGWYTNEGLTDKYQEAAVNSNVDLYVKWTQLFTVVFKDGKTELTDLALTNVKDGDVIQAPADLTKADGEFEAWFADSEFTTPFDFANTPIKANTTIYAKWKFVVTFEGMEGKQFVATNGTAATPNGIPTKEGYKFVEWIDLDQTITADTEIQASWQLIYTKYTLSVGGTDKRTLQVNTDFFVTHNNTFGDYIIKLENNKYLSFAISEENPVLVKIEVNGASGSSTAATGVRIISGTYESESKNVIYASETILASVGQKKIIDKAYYLEDAATYNLVRLNGTFNVSSVIVTVYYDLCTITLHDGDATSTVKTYKGGTAELPTPTPAEHYVFDCWKDADGNVVSNETTFADDFDIYANYSLEKFDVTFDPNGGTFAQDVSNVQKVEYNKFITLEDLPTKDGYTFAGWFDAETGGNNYSATTGNIESDITLYAQWTANQYKIRFDKNDENATGEMADVDVTYDAKAALPANTFVNGTQTFVGWNTQTDGSGTLYLNEQEIENLTSTNGDIVVLYAQWVDKLTVTFDSNGGEFEGGNTTIIGTYEKDGSEDVVLPTAPTREGYAFAGYSATATGAVITVSGKVTESTTYYAIWNLVDYSITYELNGSGVDNTANTDTYNVENKVTFADPTQENCVFGGWYITATFDEDSKIESTEGLTEDITLYAKWYDAYNKSSSEKISNWDLSELSSTLGAGKKLDYKVYEETFELVSGTSTTKSESSTTGVSFVAARINFTTVSPNATLTIITYSQNSKRLVALDADITGDAQQGSNWTDTDVKKRMSATITFTIANTGEHFITFDNAEHKLSSITLTEPAFNSNYIVSALEATITSISNTISITNAKFTTVEETPKKIDASGYKVYLDDSTEEATVTNGVIENVAAGKHKVTLKYGKYTVKEYNVEVGIISSASYSMSITGTNRVSDTAITFQGTSGTGTLVDGKINVDATTGKLAIGENVWAQFNTGTKLSFYVKAGAKVSLSGYKDTVVTMTGLEGNQTFAANGDIISKRYTADTVVVIEGQSNGYIGTLSIEYPISEATSILFGTDGNTSTAIPGVAITASFNNNGTNCAYVYNGNIEFSVAAGAKVEVYSNYKADYTINGTRVNTAGQAFYDYADATDVVIECDLDGNGDNNFYWIKITFPNA